ncbi:hypothetical protein [Isoptericola sp. b408]|uniref:hypothetical protein n=1 Tax=Isoptericola sp. b408 TaxID=3064653 RepID=UPI002713F70E|nr:hypothetical protein [Isoptericola sp. b408]MDO8151708.1 hypothetical protein [Isoptericola sp. b408]
MTNKRFRFYVFVGNDGRQLSTAWYFWADATSFYLINVDIGGLKISLHGHDRRYLGEQHYRVQPMNGKHDIRRTSSVLLVAPRRGWPLTFSGRSTGDGELVIRIRITHAATCLSESPTPVPDRPSSAKIALPANLGGWANDLELTFSQVPQGWQPANTHDEWISVEHAGTTAYIGRHQPGFMICNAQGAVLRANSRRRWTDWYPTPPHLCTPPPEGRSSDQRVVAVDVEEDGVLWIVEQATARVASDSGLR